MTSIDMQPLISLLEVRDQGLLKSALDGDEGQTNTSVCGAMLVRPCIHKHESANIRLSKQAVDIIGQTE